MNLKFYKNMFKNFIEIVIRFYKNGIITQLINRIIKVDNLNIYIFAKIQIVFILHLDTLYY